MDPTRLRLGELLTGACALGLLGVMFLDWFGGRDAWQLSTGRVLLVALVALGLLVVALTLTARPVAMPVAATVITIGVAAIVVLYVLYRVVVNEPGPNAVVDVETGAYAGLALTLGVGAGAWIALGDERTGAAASRRQAERVLAVRGAARPAPPERDPARPPRAEPRDA
jgi:hypothetical protein